MHVELIVATPSMVHRGTSMAHAHCLWHMLIAWIIRGLSLVQINGNRHAAVHGEAPQSKLLHTNSFIRHY